MAATKATTWTYTYTGPTKNKERFSCPDADAPTNSVYLAKTDKRLKGDLKKLTLTFTLQ